MESLLAYADQINVINENPYFKGLKHGQPTDQRQLQAFIRTQERFMAAIRAWPLLLAQSLTYFHDPESRLVIIKNLWDEHGNGDVAGCHINTFDRYLDALCAKAGIKRSEASMYDVAYNATTKFIAALNELYKTNQTQYVSALAMIEYVYIDVSKNIHAYVSQFIDPSKIEHYSLHEVLDVSHSRELFSLVVDRWSNRLYGSSRTDVMAGIQEGHRLFYALYAAYYDAMYLDLNPFTSVSSL